MAQITMATHTIKPSFPTPLALKNHKLAYLDQIAPAAYIPLIFFYENVEFMQQEQISRRLKQSLSEILTVFYPLAGTVTRNSYVECNDRGAEFVEARVHARLSHFLQNPKMEELEQLVPAESSSYNDDAVQLLVKTSLFDCGGISVGVCFSHRIGDFSSLSTFMNAWAATCRGEEASGTIRPSFGLAHHFPPRDVPPASGYSQGITKEKIVTKRLVFDKEKLENLRKEASNGEVKYPSRVEALTSFIWRSFIEAYKEKTTSFAASHAVNLRNRAVPPIPDHTIGNCVTFASAAVSSEENNGGSSVLVSKMRAAIRAVDDDYINNVIKDEAQSVEEAGDYFESGNCAFSSWWRFPVYDVDFGFGKPVWVCTTTMPFNNGIVLMSTPSLDGIEAWVNIPDDDFFELLLDNYNKFP